MCHQHGEIFNALLARAVRLGPVPPGRYVIEVKTVERSHFPLRRYALEVR